MRAKKRAKVAAGFAALALVSTILFWMVVPEWPNLGDSGYVLLMTIFGMAFNVLAIGLLAVPVLTGGGTRYQRVLALVGAIGIGSLLVLYLPSWMMIEVGARLAGVRQVLVGLASVGVAAILLSLSFASATVVGAGPRPQGKALTT